MERIRRVAHDLIKIEHGIEPAAVADPLVDFGPLRFAFLRPIKALRVGCDGGAVDLNPLIVCPGDNLIVSRDDFRRTGVPSTEVVDAFEDDQPLDPGLSQHIAIEAGHHVGAEAAHQNRVAANALVENRHVGGGFVGSQSRG